MKFTDLLANFGSSWPEELVNTSWPPTADVEGLLAQIDSAIELHDAAADIGEDGTVTLAATLKITTGSAPADTQLVSRLFPSMRFVFRPPLDWSSDFRCSLARDGTVTLQVDTLPLDVLVPPDLLAAHPDETQRGADTKITLSISADPTVISRDFALTLEAAGDLRLEPHFPISIGPCTLMGVPMRAVHEMLLVASPRRANKLYHWVVRDLDPDLFFFDCGGLGFGGMEFDFATPDGNLAEIRKAAHIRPDAELVIEDVVIPAVFFPPLPQHGTLGLRRSLAPGQSLESFLSFDTAPIQFALGNSATLFFDQLYFKTPPAGTPLIQGLSLEAGIAVSFGDDGQNDDWDFSLGLIDGDVLRVSVARKPPSPTADGLPILDLDVWAATVAIIRARFGLSLSALQKPDVDAGKAIQALGDILIREKPDTEASPVKIKTEDGKPFELALVDVGWDRGSISGSILKQKDLTLTMGPFALELHEAGFVAEDGATYISLSGGIRQSTDPFTGRVFFERLRGRLAGNPDAASFKIGGFGASLEIKNTITIEVHGSYRNEVLTDGTRLKEFGLGGKLTIFAAKKQWGLSLDVYWGTRTAVSGDPLNYRLLQSVLFGAIPMGPVELRQIELLYGDNIQPKLSPDPAAVGQLKYYPWLKKSRPTALPEDRGLTAWKPVKDTWAFGAGFGISFTGCGTLCLATAFVLGFDGEEETTASGLIVVLELKILGKDKPIAVGVFEYDFRTDVWLVQLIVDIKLQELIKNFPQDLKVQIGGTITVGNKPGLVAVGRIDNQDTWLAAKIDIKLDSLATLRMRIALVFEWLESQYVGGGFMFSISVETKIGPMKLKGWGSLVVLLRYMLSGTNDYVARIQFDMGFAIVLFGFLKFGISMSLLADWLAHAPDYFLFRATFRLETPWFMPDFSVTVECTSGELQPAARPMLSGAMMDASARSVVGTRPMRVQRIDGLPGGDQPQLQALLTLPGNATLWQGQAVPVPLDATIEIQFSPMLADRVGIGQTNADLGRQVTGDGNMSIEAVYELTAVEVRRRPRGTSTWQVVESFASAADPRKGRWAWDADTRTGGETAPKKLLYNGSTPFTVAEDDPLADAEILDENPGFPCCLRRNPDVARLDFHDEPQGAYPLGFLRTLRFVRRATPAPIRARLAACSIRPPAQPASGVPRIASFTAGLPISLNAEEDLAEITISFATVARTLTIAFIARDDEGEIVDRIEKTLNGNTAFQTLIVKPEKVFRSLDVRVETNASPDSTDPKLFAAVEVDFIEALFEADRARAEDDRLRCDRIDTDGHGSKAPFLPQHEYEIALTTRVSIRHTTTSFETRTMVERASFITGGIPGLNETSEPGLEMRPYVVNRPPGGRGRVYRNEAVHLVLSPDLRLFGPGASGDDEQGFRYPVTLTVGTRFDSRPEAAAEGSSFESNDWFVDHRGTGGGLIVATPLHDLILALSPGGLRRRYQVLSQTSGGTCPPDDVWTEPRPRLGVEPFDAAGRPLWQARSGYHAAMRPAGSPVVDRSPFEAADLTAFRATTGAWTVEDGVLRAEAASTGRFGEPDWDSLSLQVTGSVAASGHLSASVLIAATNPGGGLRFTVSANADGSATLAAQPLAGGPAIDSRAIGALPETVCLRVDVFADRVRATAAGVTVGVDRGTETSGVCELGAAQAGIASLSVRGLEMYGFDFDTSRYDSFAAHIATASALGQLPVAGAEDSLAAVLARLGGEISAAMSPTAADSDRERVFGEAVRSLAVPLREAPERVHLDLATAGADRWFVLESPEPIDLVEEVTLDMRRRVPLPPIDPALVAKVRAALADLFQPGPLPLPPTHPPLDPTRRPAPSPLVRDAERLGPRAKAALTGRQPLNPRPIPGARPFISVELVGTRFVITLLTTHATTTRPATGFTRAEILALRGVTLFFDRAGRLVDWTRPDDAEWRAVGLTTIQNADGTHVLLFPQGGLPSGDYRLQFEITRRWFETTAPISADNAYQDETTLTFSVP